jgi:hypothetical protein
MVWATTNVVRGQRGDRWAIIHMASGYPTSRYSIGCHPHGARNTRATDTVTSNAQRRYAILP